MCIFGEYIMFTFLLGAFVALTAPPPLHHHVLAHTYTLKFPHPHPPFHMHTYIHTCTHTYIHTHTHTRSHTPTTTTATPVIGEPTDAALLANEEAARAFYKDLWADDDTFLKSAAEVCVGGWVGVVGVCGWVGGWVCERDGVRWGGCGRGWDWVRVG
jgi:hypothetical protein